MNKSIFVHAKEVAKELGISEAHAYKLVREMSGELEKDGLIVISGRVIRAYFYKKVYVSDRGGL